MPMQERLPPEARAGSGNATATSAAGVKEGADQQ